jgi:hypothetical protein
VQVVKLVDDLIWINLDSKLAFVIIEEKAISWTTDMTSERHLARDRM